MPLMDGLLDAEGLASVGFLSENYHLCPYALM
jgi:hypothetical protein